LSGVDLKNISKSFGDTQVIADVSLTVQAGEFIVFLGPSGCGKSTLLRIIAGLERADSGEVHIDGRRVDTLPPGKRGVAMVFQHYALYPHMTIRENMSFGLENVGVEKGEVGRRIDEAARMLEIEPLLDRKPTQLSGGQRQRVAIGRAIVKEPKLFLFDEPLSNLDAALRSRTRVEIAQLHQRVRATMIFVTHDQVEAMTLADRIVLMNAQKIEQIGTPMEIYMRPATAFVAGFVGSPKINFLPAEIAADERGLARATLIGEATVDSGVPAADLPTGPGFRIGVRPEEVRVAAAGKGQLNGQARVVERLGDRTLVHVELTDGAIVIAEDAGMSAVSVGDAVGLDLGSARIHIFDESGKGYHAPDPTVGQANG
jgi:multiple sugar transport system ATP-binding protein